MSQSDLNLDVASPAEALRVLRAARDTYADAASECTSNWQDEGAGKPWTILAQELDKAIDRIEARYARTVWKQER